MPLPQKIFPPLRRAFTLIELMVVIAIIVIIIAISLPALKALTKGNDTAQATSMLSSLIASARSIAISQGRVAGVALYEDNNGNGNTASQTAAMYVINDLPYAASLAAPANANIYLIPYGNATLQQLPRGAKIAGIDTTNAASGGTLYTGANGNAQVPARVILFDESGQMLVTSNVFVEPSNAPTPAIAATNTHIQTILTQWNPTSPTNDWHWSAASPNTVNASTPALVVYSFDEFNSAGMVGQSAANQNQWLLQHAKVLVINAYTGTVIQ